MNNRLLLLLTVILIVFGITVEHRVFVEKI